MILGELNVDLSFNNLFFTTHILYTNAKGPSPFMEAGPWLIRLLDKG
jgi:hypothetical protein